MSDAFVNVVLFIIFIILWLPAGYLTHLLYRKIRVRIEEGSYPMEKCLDDLKYELDDLIIKVKQCDDIQERKRLGCIKNSLRDRVKFIENFVNITSISSNIIWVIICMLAMFIYVLPLWIICKIIFGSKSSGFPLWIIFSILSWLYVKYIASKCRKY